MGGIFYCITLHEDWMTKINKTIIIILISWSNDDQSTTVSRIRAGRGNVLGWKSQIDEILVLKTILSLRWSNLSVEPTLFDKFDGVLFGCSLALKAAEWKTALGPVFNEAKLLLRARLQSCILQTSLYLLEIRRHIRWSRSCSMPIVHTQWAERPTTLVKAV